LLSLDGYIIYTNIEYKLFIMQK